MITDELLFRFLNQETTTRENRRIRDWLVAHPDHSTRLNLLQEIMESDGQLVHPEEIVNEWNKLEPRLLDRPDSVRLQSTLAVRLARIAAVLLILMGSGLFWYYRMNTHILRNTDPYTKSVYLPDGTQVYIGPGSKIAYNSKFLEGIREVRLTGEAFFDVTSDPEHSFTVIAGSARIKVTGTQFVVNASPRSQEVEVTVKSGNVLFYNSETLNENSYRMGLVAGEKGIFYTSLNRMDKTRDTNFQSAP